VVKVAANKLEQNNIARMNIIFFIIPSHWFTRITYIAPLFGGCPLLKTKKPFQPESVEKATALQFATTSILRAHNFYVKPITTFSLSKISKGINKSIDTKNPWRSMITRVFCICQISPAKNY